MRGVAEHLLDGMGRAGVDRAFVVLRTGKWDIPTFLEERAGTNPEIAYIVTQGTMGVPYTLARAVPFLGASRVLFGLPDVVFEPRNALRTLRDRLEEGGTEVVLGVFPTSRPGKSDMVRCSDDGRVTEIEIKPGRTDLRYAWALAAWSPQFSEFLARWCREHRSRWADRDSASGPPEPPEPHLGHVLQDGIDAGLPIHAVPFEEGGFIDVGTPEDLCAAAPEFARPGRQDEEGGGRIRRGEAREDGS